MTEETVEIIRRYYKLKDALDRIPGASLHVESFRSVGRALFCDDWERLSELLNQPNLNTPNQ